MTFAVRCGPEAHAWVARCAAEAGLPMSLTGCPADVAVVEVRAEGTPLAVEIARAPRGFRTVGAYGLSPVGEFADWKATPAPTQRAFSAVVGCAERAPPEPLLSAEAPPAGGALPWSLSLAVALVAALAVLRRPSVSAVGSAALATATVALLRRAALGVGFFHQNGQGPDWIAAALRGEATDYGPGYGELFGWVAARAARPDLGVFAAIAALMSVAPAAVFVAARSIGTSRGIAAAAALVLAADPVLAKLAGSESYFGAISALLALAIAALAAGFADPRWTRRALAVAAAGLLLAEAARVHPLAWVPCALAPLVVALVPAASLRATATAVVGVALVAGPWTLPVVRSVLGGRLQRFLPGARAVFVERAPWVAVIGVVLLALAVVLRRVVRVRVAPAIALGVFGLTAAAASTTDVLRGDAPVVAAAHLHLFLPSLLVAGVALTVGASPRVTTGLAAGLVACGFVHGLRERPLLRPPTDVEEQAFALAFRERLPAAAEVAALQRAGERLLTMPLYAGRTARPVAIDLAGRALFTTGPRFYLRTSLCSTDEGRAACAAFEGTHTLRLLDRRVLAARGSLPWLPLQGPTVEVALFAVD